MGWSLRLGSVFGVPVRVHFTFAVLLIWFAVTRHRQGHDLVLAAVFLLAVFGCVLLHELGHAGVAKLFGVTTREIVLYPIGGIARLERIPGGLAELFIALAGPAVNLVIAGGLTLTMLLFLPASFQVDDLLLGWPDLLPWLLVANLMLFLFNLIPAFPMDGGRVLRALLSLALPMERATQIAATIGQAIALLFGLGGLLTGQVLLMLVAIFVFLGAAQEAAFFRRRAVVSGKVAGDAMMTRLASLAPQDSLEHAARLLVEGSQPAFPVIDSWGRLVGVLPRFLLLEGLSRAGTSAAVLQIMARDPAVVGPEASLDDVLDLLRSRPRFPVLVMENEKLAGMITWENLTEFIDVSRSAASAGS